MTNAKTNCLSDLYALTVCLNKNKSTTFSLLSMLCLNINYYCYFFSAILIERRRIMISKKNVSVDETTRKSLSTKTEIDVSVDETTKKSLSLMLKIVDETIAENFKMSWRRNENMTTKKKRKNDDDELSTTTEIAENDNLSTRKIFFCLTIIVEDDNLSTSTETAENDNLSTMKDFFNIIDLKSFWRFDIIIMCKILILSNQVHSIF